MHSVIQDEVRVSELFDRQMRHDVIRKKKKRKREMMDSLEQRREQNKGLGYGDLSCTAWTWLNQNNQGLL